MENEPKEEKSLNGFSITKRGKVNAENLADSILSRESIEEVMHDFENEGIGLEQIADLRSTLADERQSGKISDDRKRALDRLEEVQFSIIGSPENTREEGDTFIGESGKGRWAAPGRNIPGISGRGRKKT